MSRSLGRLVRRLPLMAASLALAIAFWFFVNVREKIEVGHLVPLAFERFPQHLVIDGAPLEAVYVRLRGNRRAIEGLDPQQLRVSVDLAAVHLGNNTLPLSATQLVVPQGVSVIGISPPAVNLRFISRPRTPEEAPR